MPHEIKVKNGGVLKPPRKGEPSPNKNGRPKGALGVRTIIERWLEATEVVTNPITKQQETLSQMDLITLGQIKEARKGNTIAFNALMDRYLGKPVQAIEQTGKDGAPLPAPRVTIIETH